MVNFFEKFPRWFTAAHKHANTNYKISRKKDQVTTGKTIIYFVYTGIYEKWNLCY